METEFQRIVHLTSTYNNGHIVTPQYVLDAFGKKSTAPNASFGIPTQEAQQLFVRKCIDDYAEAKTGNNSFQELRNYGLLMSFISCFPKFASYAVAYEDQINLWGKRDSGEGSPARPLPLGKEKS